MGFTSVISTLATNIRIRSREFAILKSVGMTNASLYKMLYCESVICIIKAFIPIIIVLMAMIDLGKAVIASKEDEIKAAQKLLIKRVVFYL